MGRGCFSWGIFSSMRMRQGKGLQISSYVLYIRHRLAISLENNHWYWLAPSQLALYMYFSWKMKIGFLCTTGITEFSGLCLSNAWSLRPRPAE
jgi:hypothetical protein